MANPEHLEILMEGRIKWKGWRNTYPEISPDLEGAELYQLDLYGIYFYGVNFSRAEIIECNFYDSRFEGTNFEYAKIVETNFSQAVLKNTNLKHARLWSTNFTDTELENVDFGEANLHGTYFANIDFKKVTGLNRCVHSGPSIIDHRTLMNSGNLPISFLRGCGLPDALIEYLPSLRSEPIQFYSCFISHSHKDDDFAHRLHADLQNRSVRCWFAPEDLRIGDKTRRRIDDSIRVHDKLLLILSYNSIASGWVEYETERALEQEHKRSETVLFPIRLDDTIMKVEGTWADHIRERHIGDFRNWKDHDSYQNGFERLMRDLKAEQVKKNHQESLRNAKPS